MGIRIIWVEGMRPLLLALLVRLLTTHPFRDEAVGGGGRWYYWYDATTQLPLLGDRE